jgi:5-methylcytosine-specific restriction protein A
MTEWMMSANGKIYDHQKAFSEQGFIYWRKVRNFSKGDVIYIYCTKPIGKIMYVTEVEDSDISYAEVLDSTNYYFGSCKPIEGCYIKLALRKKYDGDKMDLSDLNRFDFYPPQGPCIIRNPELLKYIKGIFAESAQ